MGKAGTHLAFAIESQLDNEKAGMLDDLAPDLGALRDRREDEDRREQVVLALEDGDGRLAAAASRGEKVSHARTSGRGARRGRTGQRRC